MNKGRGNFQNFDGRESQSSKSSTFQKGKTLAIRLLDQTNLEVTMLEVEEEEGWLTRVVCSALIVKSLVIFKIVQCQQERTSRR